MPNPFIRFTQSGSAGKYQLLATNISARPIIAFVCTVEVGSSGGTRVITYKSVYSGPSNLPAGKTAEIAVQDQPIALETLKVDYVRLLDGTEWGERKTETGRSVAGLFRDRGVSANETGEHSKR